MVQAGLIPNVRSYDPTFSYEVVTLVQHGMPRMLAEQHDEYWYITLMNENYSHPAMPEGSAEGIIKGMSLFKDARSEEHTSELQSLMRNSYAVFCLNQTTKQIPNKC